MAKVNWISNGVEYRAVKLMDDDQIRFISTIQEEIGDLFKQGFKTTKVIAQPLTVLRIIANGGLFINNYENDYHLIFQIDRRLGGTVYLLYEEADLKQIEATEFTGLETLP